MMKFRSHGHLLLILFPILLSSCAAKQPASAADTVSIEDFRAASRGDEPLLCLSTHQYESVKIVNERILVFVGSDDEAWANELQFPCPGLRPGDVLVFDMHGRRVCEHDSVSPTRQRSMGYLRRGPRCVLGEFSPFSFSILTGPQESLEGK